ncbi:50S ribosomal protein L27 [Candidatus Hodgkinia cicadicola]
MAQKHTGGITKNGRDSQSKRLGLKQYKNNIVYPGYILLRQRGTKYLAGEGTSLAKDYSVHALIKGTVAFRTTNKKKTITVTNNGNRTRTCDL